MSEKRIHRRLAAILAADVVGFSRLMEADEAGTLAALRSRRSDVLEPAVARYGGRIFKIAGDGALAEFSSAVNAVQCAIELQDQMAAANVEAPEGRAIVLRVAVNLGDVLVEGSDLYGDGVNIAARLEALAEPGGVLLSQSTYEQVRGKIGASIDDIGLQTLKNISEPVRAYRIGNRPRSAEPRAAVRMERPSIAILAFANMSGDVEQEYFSDGISEDLITELSKFHSLVVISRNSSFAFKGKGVSIGEIGNRLHARYVVEGSVRRSQNRLRITAQLIDAGNDSHLWAERFDREITDIFDIQDEVVRAIIAAIEPNLLSSEQKRALRKPPESLDAWENYQRGLWYMFHYRAEDRDHTIGYFERAIALDPGFASAHAGLSYATYIYILLGASLDRAADKVRAQVEARTAVRLDERDPFAWVALGRAHLLRAEHAAAIDAADIAISLNPNFVMAHFGRAHALWHAGRPAEAIASHDIALRLGPLDPTVWSVQASKAIALVMLGRFEEAIDLSKRCQRHALAAIFTHLAEISALGHLNRLDEARDAIARARAKKPDISISYVDETLPITDAACRNTFLGGLRAAGMPD